MNDFRHALSKHELVTLRVIGEWWDLELTGLQKTACVNALAEALSKLNLSQEIAYLSPEEAKAVSELLAEGGKIPVGSFERDHGAVREMGPGRLEREEPWLDPISAAEALWYRGLIFRGFDESAENELVEFYYLPNELIDQGEAGEEEAGEIIEPGLISMETVPDPASYTPARSDAVDDLVHLLAESQKRPLDADQLAIQDKHLLNAEPDRLSLLFELARELGLLRSADGGFRTARRAIDWLQQSREQQIRQMIDAWSSSSWNDLCHTPGLLCEGSGWQNEPILARNALFDVLPRTSAWYNLEDLVSLMHETNPDFQRPGGNYDIWYIRDVEQDAYLAGFENWSFVEGRLIRFLIQGPMKWLGLVDTAATAKPGLLLFRLTKRALAWLADEPPSEDEIKVPIVVQNDGNILVPFNADRYHRFQVARVCEPSVLEVGKPFTYTLTPASLHLVREQGAGSERLLRFLEEASGRSIPAGLRRAVERWEENGVEARLEHVFILRVLDPEILAKLRSNSKTGRYLGEAMSDLAVVVLPGKWQALRRTAASLGLLFDYSPDDSGE